MKKDLSSVLAAADVKLGPKSEAKLLKAMEIVLEHQTVAFTERVQQISKVHQAELNDLVEMRKTDLVQSSTETLLTLRTGLNDMREIEQNASQISETVQRQSSGLENRMQQLSTNMGQVQNQLGQASAILFRWSLTKAALGISMIVGVIFASLIILIFMNGKIAWRQSQVQKLTEQIATMTVRRDRIEAQAMFFRTTYGVTFNTSNPRKPTITLPKGLAFSRTTYVDRNNATHNDWEVE
jgi:hypothetical protein